MNKLDGYNVTWVDETDKSLRPINIPSQFNDFDNIQKSLPFNLFKTFIQVYYGCEKVVTITVYYTQNKVLVQGNYCPVWRKGELYNLVWCLNTSSWSMMIPALPGQMWASVSSSSHRHRHPSLRQTQHQHQQQQLVREKPA
jgi:hypothetical protein